MTPTENSWDAWRNAVLTKLETLEGNHKHLEQEIHVLRDMLIETVGRSGRNGRLGNLEDRVKRHENSDRFRLWLGGTAGGGILVALVELVKLVAG